MNSVTIYGVIASDPLYASGSRTRTLDVTVAVERPSRKQGGSGADFVPVRLWNATADSMRKVSRGDTILVQGRLRVERGGDCVVSGHDAWLVKGAK